VSAAASGYSLLRGRGTGNFNQSGYYWSNSENEEMPITSVPNVAAQAVLGGAAQFGKSKILV
jgi:hypothetical protein